MTTALVTGGAGFIGSHLCDVLVARGVSVHVLDNLSRGAEDWLPDGAHLHRGDIRDAHAVRSLMRDTRPEIVVHLAAMHFIPAVDDAPELAEAINVAGTANVARAAAEAPPRVLVFASSAAVYPNVSGPISETVEPAPIDLYGRTKSVGEELLRDLAHDSGVSCVAARLFNVIGPRETNPHLVPEIVDQVARGASEIVLGNVETRRDYVDARDVAVALAALADNAPGGFAVFNVGTGVAASAVDVVRLCSEIVGRPLSIRQDPARLRRVDRPELVADPVRLQRSSAWTAQRTLRDTLTDLLAA